MRYLVLLLTAIGAASAFAQDAYEAGITLSKDEKFFAVGNAGKSVKLYRTEDGKLVRTFAFPNSFLTKPAFSPDGKLLTAGNVDPDSGFNPIWRIDDGKVVAKFGLYTGKDAAHPCNVVGFSGDGKLLLGQVHWDAAGSLAWHTSPWAHAYYYPELRERGIGVSAVSPKGSLLVTMIDRNVEFYDPIRGYVDEWNRWSVDWPEDVVYMTFSGDANVLVVGGDGWVGSLDWRVLPTEGVIIDTGRRIDNTHRVKKSEFIANFILRSVCSSFDGNEAFLGSRDGRIARVDLKTGKCTKIWQAFPDPVKGLVLTKSGTLLSYDLARIKYWTQDGELLRTVGD
jgi:WD40 repeat protein